MGDLRVLPDGQSLPPPCGDALGKAFARDQSSKREVRAVVQPAAREEGTLLGGSIPIGPRPEGEPSAGASSVHRAESRAGAVGGAGERLEMEQLSRDGRPRGGA